MENITLYSYWRSSASYRIRIALNHKNLPFEYKSIHLVKNGGEQYDPEYQSMNPMSQVPTLKHNGFTLTQSMAIIEYLDECFPQKPLFPSHPIEKSQVRSFCENINSGIHPLQNLKVLQKITRDNSLSESQKIEWAHYWIYEGFRSLEKQLQTSAGAFCFHDQLTAADMFLIPQIYNAERFAVEMTEFPLIQKVQESCRGLECFKKAHPDFQPDTPAK